MVQNYLLPSTLLSPSRSDLRRWNTNINQCCQGFCQRVRPFIRQCLRYRAPCVHSNLLQFPKHLPLLIVVNDVLDVTVRSGVPSCSCRLFSVAFFLLCFPAKVGVVQCNNGGSSVYQQPGRNCSLTSSILPLGWLKRTSATVSGFPSTANKQHLVTYADA